MDFVSRIFDLSSQLLDLLFPEPLHLVVHLHCGELVHRDYHALAEVTTAGKMIDNVAGDGCQPVISLDDFQLAGEPVLQLCPLGIVKILVLQDSEQLPCSESKVG